MNDATQTILLIAGTAEARALSRQISASLPAARLITSLAGATDHPAAHGGVMRVGGFGGAAGLARFLLAEGVTHLVDAAHPFAAGMHRNASAAALATGVRSLVLMRPPWPERPGWQAFSCLGTASAALPADARPFLALGRRHLALFRHRPDLRPVLRMAEAPRAPLPFPADIIIGPPSGDTAMEAGLLRRYAVTHLVCRNSGGAAGLAKLDAAAQLDIPVLMIARPPAPEGKPVATVSAALAWLAQDMTAG